MTNEPLLKFEDKSTEDSIEFLIQRDGTLDIEMNSPWCGDSISGFGASINFILTNEQVKELIKFLSIGFKE